MPSVAPEAVDKTYRVVIDEASFDFHGLQRTAIDETIDGFNEALDTVGRDDGAVPPCFWEVECDDGLELGQFVFGERCVIDRDIRRRFITLLDRRPEWDDAIPGVPINVAIGDGALQSAFSVGYALHHATARFHIACLGLHVTGRRGLMAVSDGERDGQVFFVDCAAVLPEFWRALLDREAVAEGDFMRFAQAAFPDLVFASGLSFGKFDGPYTRLSPWVLKTFVMLNDGFAEALAEAHGDTQVVQKRLGHFGVEVSPEGPNTHGNAKAMREREIKHEGLDFACEWHSKASLGGPNRIHFSLPDSRLDGRILVGIFTAHLTL